MEINSRREFELGDLEQLAEKFADENLSPYIDELKNSRRKFTRKEINDALWGTISLTPVEVGILDSPLLQRLRYVRQLGVVHWIYPGALHTRFEHSIGVLYQIQSLISAINSTSNELVVIGANLVHVLRLCALLHDIGHAAFSHVSEMAIETLSESSLIKTKFAKNLEIEGKQFSEMFAYYLIRSKSMRSLFQILLSTNEHSIKFDPDQDRNLEQTIEKISNAIIGIKIDDRLPLLHELISGPFDADKLDYFARDAKLAGTPQVLDISRLVQKLTVRPLETADLPEEIAKRVAKIDDKYYLFGLKWSGLAVLDELHLARVLLFAKIYKHTKVVAVEQMLGSVIINLAKLFPISEVIWFLYSNTDDSLFGMDAPRLANALTLQFESCDGPARERLRCAADTLKAMKNRRLWVKAVQIERRYPNDPNEKLPEHSAGLIELREDIEHVEYRQNFIRELRAEVSTILKLRNMAISEIALESSIMVHAVGSLPGGTQINRAYLIPVADKPIPYREYKVNRQHWADSYHTDQPIGYIFSPPWLADIVYVAAEKLIRSKYKVRLPLSALEVSKRDSKNVQELKKLLGNTDYYKGAPFDIRPALERMSRADVDQIVNEFCTLRSSIQEPQSSGLGTNGCGTVNLRTISWLRQFDDNKHVECALRLLKSFKVLSRLEFNQALKGFLAANNQFVGANVVPIGSYKDSGSVQAYYAADLLGTQISAVTSLEEACQKEPVPIIFVDDFAGSGNQVSDLLAAGFALNEERRGLHEQRDMFNSDIQNRLRNVPVGFVFTAAWDSGIDNIKQLAAKLKLNATIYRLLDEKQIPFAFESGFEDIDSETIESFKQRCREIGASLLRNPADGSTQTAESESKLQTRLLGYGNRAMLLATPYNVPSQTLTAIWAQGMVDGVEWVPLIARRKKN